MHVMAIVGMLMVYTYATATAAPSPLRYENPNSNVTLTLALTSNTNALPPDPNIMELPSVGLVRCYSYGYSQWELDIVGVLYQAVYNTWILLVHGQADQPISYPLRYSSGHASLAIDTSPQATWFELSLVLGFLGLSAHGYTPGTFSLRVSGGPSGVWNGSLTTN